MNNKGFTLVELLSTITIMALIATITTINVTKVFDDNNKENEENKTNIITTAACLYIELNENKELKNTCLNSGCDISTNVLINSGLLKEEDVSNSKIIHIYKENNEKKCIIK